MNHHQLRKAAPTGECGARPKVLDKTRPDNTFRPTLKQWLDARADVARMTDLHGAQVYRRRFYPDQFVFAGDAFADEIECVRGLLGGGEEARIFGPLESIVILTGHLALEYLEAMR